MKKTRSESREEPVEPTCVRPIESWTVILKGCWTVQEGILTRLSWLQQVRSYAQSVAAVRKPPVLVSCPKLVMDLVIADESVHSILSLRAVNRSDAVNRTEDTDTSGSRISLLFCCRRKGKAKRATIPIVEGSRSQPSCSILPVFHPFLSTVTAQSRIHGLAAAYSASAKAPSEVNRGL